MWRKMANAAGCLALGLGIVAAWVFLRGGSVNTATNGWLVLSLAVLLALFFIVVRLSTRRS